MDTITTSDYIYTGISEYDTDDVEHIKYIKIINPNTSKATAANVKSATQLLITNGILINNYTGETLTDTSLATTAYIQSDTINNLDIS